LIAVIGTLDTKGEAIAYLSEKIRAAGEPTCVIDTGARGVPVGVADVSREEVASRAGARLEQFESDDTGKAIGAMASGLTEVLTTLVAEGKLNGAVAVGGGQGTVLATVAMQTLPLGMPKLMVSTMASGANRFEPYVGTSDMTLMHSVGDILGVDAISVIVMGNAAAAIAAMARSYRAQGPFGGGRKVVGATMLGPTTSFVTQARDRLRESGLDVVAFHANGTGGRCLDRLVSEEKIQATLDAGLQELVAHICGGVFGGGAARMCAAGEKGVPQVVVPGATDYVVLGPLETLSEEQRSRPLVIHNAQLTRVRTTLDEMSAIGEAMVERLNRAGGPTAVLVPLAGFSQTDRPDGPFHDPAANAALIERLSAGLRKEIELICLDVHINESAFASAVAEKLTELLG